MKQRLLQLEAVLALVLAWGLVFLFSLRLMGWMKHPGGDLAPVAPPILARAGVVCARLHKVAIRLPWHSTCLVRAVAGMLLLHRRGIGGAVIRFGVRKKEAVLEAHAWLLLGGIILLGRDEIGSYAPLADFSSHRDG